MYTVQLIRVIQFGLCNYVILHEAESTDYNKCGGAEL